MVTFNDNHRWVFPLAPTACDYAKLDGYFGKLRNAEISALQMQGYFGEYLDLRKVAKSKPKINEQNGKSPIDCFGRERRNSKHFCENGERAFGMRGSRDDVGELKAIERLFQLQGDFGSARKECGNLENLKNVADLGKGGEIIQLQKGEKRNGEFAKPNKEIGERTWKGDSKD